MKHLHHLNLSHNFLSGPIGNVFTGLQNLKRLDLSYNRFTGYLPSSFGNLMNLSALFLQNNEFTGAVVYLANLHLTVLNIENNKFNGVIPKQFQYIPNLWIGGNQFHIKGDYPSWNFPLDNISSHSNVSSERESNPMKRYPSLAKPLGRFIGFLILAFLTLCNSVDYLGCLEAGFLRNFVKVRSAIVHFRKVNAKKLSRIKLGSAGFVAITYGEAGRIVHIRGLKFEPRHSIEAAVVCRTPDRINKYFEYTVLDERRNHQVKIRIELGSLVATAQFIRDFRYAQNDANPLPVLQVTNNAAAITGRGRGRREGRGGARRNEAVTEVAGKTASRIIRVSQTDDGTAE